MVNKTPVIKGQEGGQIKDNSLRGHKSSRGKEERPRKGMKGKYGHLWGGWREEECPSAEC